MKEIPTEKNIAGLNFNSKFPWKLPLSQNSA